MDSETFDRCIKNTVDIAEKCHVMLELGKSPLPEYEVPAGYTIDTYLEYIVHVGLKNVMEKFPHQFRNV